MFVEHGELADGDVAELVRRVRDLVRRQVLEHERLAEPTLLVELAGAHRIGQLLFDDVEERIHREPAAQHCSQQRALATGARLRSSAAMSELLPAVEIDPKGPVRASVIWLMVGPVP